MIPCQVQVSSENKNPTTDLSLKGGRTGVGCRVHRDFCYNSKSRQTELHPDPLLHCVDVSRTVVKEVEVFADVGSSPHVPSLPSPGRRWGLAHFSRPASSPSLIRVFTTLLCRKGASRLWLGDDPLLSHRREDYCFRRYKQRWTDGPEILYLLVLQSHLESPVSPVRHSTPTSAQGTETPLYRRLH